MFLGPKKNPQLAVLSLAPPNPNHIPSLPEPTVGGPSKPTSTPPSHQWGDLTHVLIEQPTVKMKVTLQTQTAEKHPAPSLPILTPVGE